jgi:hypothetical protein
VEAEAGRRELAAARDAAAAAAERADAAETAARTATPFSAASPGDPPAPAPDDAPTPAPHGARAPHGPPADDPTTALDLRPGTRHALPGAPATDRLRSARPGLRGPAGAAAAGEDRPRPAFVAFLVLFALAFVLGGAVLAAQIL